MDISINFKLVQDHAEPKEGGTTHCFSISMETGPALADLAEPIFISSSEAHSPEHAARLAMERAAAKVKAALTEEVRRLLISIGSQT